MHFELDEDWERHGFTPQEAKKWDDAWVLNPEEASAWKAAGFTPDEARKWQDVVAGKPEEASAWKAAGFTPDEAKKWDDAALNLEEASAWKAAGFTPDEAKNWNEDWVLNPEEASAWRKAGFTPEEAKKQQVEGTSIEEAIALKAGGSKPHRADAEGTRSVGGLNYRLLLWTYRRLVHKIKVCMYCREPFAKDDIRIAYHAIDADATARDRSKYGQLRYWTVFHEHCEEPGKEFFRGMKLTYWDPFHPDYSKRYVVHGKHIGER